MALDVLHFSRLISTAATALAVITANRRHVMGATLELETGIRRAATYDFLEGDSS